MTWLFNSSKVARHTPTIQNKHRCEILTHNSCTNTDKSIKMREERGKGIASAHRDDSIEDNLRHFEEMKTGSPEGTRWCLRAKISVDSQNKALRDPVIYRCNLIPHHRTGYEIAYFHWSRLMTSGIIVEISGKYTPLTTLRAPSWTPLRVLLMPSEPMSIANEMHSING